MRDIADVEYLEENLKTRINISIKTPAASRGAFWLAE